MSTIPKAQLSPMSGRRPAHCCDKLVPTSTRWPSRAGSSSWVSRWSARTAVVTLTSSVSLLCQPPLAVSGARPDPRYGRSAAVGTDYRDPMLGMAPAGGAPRCARWSARSSSLSGCPVREDRPAAPPPGRATAEEQGRGPDQPRPQRARPCQVRRDLRRPRVRRARRRRRLAARRRRVLARLGSEVIAELSQELSTRRTTHGSRNSTSTVSLLNRRSGAATDWMICARPAACEPRPYRALGADDANCRPQSSDTT